MTGVCAGAKQDRNDNLTSKLNEIHGKPAMASKRNRPDRGTLKERTRGMSKQDNLSKRDAASRTEQLFNLANDHWEKGELRAAFKIFLAAAKQGDGASQLNIGYFYDVGIGVRADRSSALYWYKRLYRRGNAEAACNIGTIWRDQGKIARALRWFKKAVELGDEGANLQIAKLYLNEKDIHKAMLYLEKTWKSDLVSEATAEEARSLFNTVAKKAGSIKGNVNRMFFP
jgi:TPR repeat protein